MIEQILYLRNIWKHMTECKLSLVIRDSQVKVRTQEEMDHLDDNMKVWRKFLLM